MTKLLLAQYQLEYETTNISIDELCEEYSITKEDLKGHEEWKKKDLLLTTTPPPPDNISIPATQALVKPSLEEPEDIKAQIAEFKKNTVQHCLTFSKTDIRFAEIKEIKDMVSVIDSIEKSYEKNQNQGPTINVLVQNIMGSMQDDC